MKGVLKEGRWIIELRAQCNSLYLEGLVRSNFRRRKKLYRSITGAGVNLSARPTALVGEQFFYHTSPLDWFWSSPCVFPISKPMKTFVHHGKNCLHNTPKMIQTKSQSRQKFKLIVRNRAHLRLSLCALYLMAVPVGRLNTWEKKLWDQHLKMCSFGIQMYNIYQFNVCQQR